MKKELERYKKRFDEITGLLGDELAMEDQKRFIALSKEYKEVAQVVEEMRGLEANRAALASNKELLAVEKDEELLAMGREEEEALRAEGVAIEERLKVLLVPKDSDDDKNVILELRAGTGGDEAAIWVGDLFRMYQRFSEMKRWRLEVIDRTAGSSGGYKEIIATITGGGVYGLLRYESGVHRVQRVPATETQGRIHTSAASVVVLPEMEAVEVKLDMKEIKKETFCASGPGGQSVNTTYSAVRLTHTPTGIVVSCQDGKSQIQNFEKAMQVLRARVSGQVKKEQEDAISQERKMMVGSQDRSAKIRTYNYPRSAVTDHRIDYTRHNLTAMLDGEIGEVLEALRLANRKSLKRG